jgi:hypothetical protein
LQQARRGGDAEVIFVREIEEILLFKAEAGKTGVFLAGNIEGAVQRGRRRSPRRRLRQGVRCLL